ncbi:uncharacterized protein LOC129598642 isoform X2 [Paramacrobiotus metropolitanus]|uniref:uncharacterized protein LOC129598642 isoform X2 n=1 Tax=Paramacrobiotus metropolitanus TaxID=2943436 RepID=UPI0024456474|nr:uncharacterized protein LOC129598642 isoform X2 [Paramacrobiotus metropolitanus]
MRVMSQLALISFPVAVQLTAVQRVEVADLANTLSHLLPRFLELDDDDFLEICKISDKLQEQIEAHLEKYGLRESRSRIAGHIALLYAFTKKALAIIGKTGIVPSDLDGYVMSAMRKTASTWQTPALPKRRDLEIPTQVSTPTKRPKSLASFGTVLSTAVSVSDPGQIGRYVKLSKDKKLLYFRDREAEKLILSQGGEVGFLNGIRDVVRAIPGASVSRDARFMGESGTQKAMAVSVGYISADLLQQLGGDIEKDVEGKVANAEIVEEYALTTAVLAPSKVTLPSPATSEEQNPEAAKSCGQRTGGSSYSAGQPFPKPVLSDGIPTDSHRRKLDFDVPPVLPNNAKACGKQTVKKKAFKPDVVAHSAICCTCKTDATNQKETVTCVNCGKVFHIHCVIPRRSKSKLDKTKWNCKPCITSAAE